MTASSSSWLRYAPYFERERARLLQGLAFVAGRMVCLALLLLALRRVVDGFASRTGLDAPLRAAAVAALLAVVGSLCAWAGRRALTRAVKTAVARLRRDLLAKVYRIPVATIERGGRMAVHMRLVHDTEMLDRLASALLAVIVPSALAVGVLIPALLWVAPLFGLASLLAMVPIWLAGRSTGAATRRRTRAFRQSFEAFGKGALARIERVELARTVSAESIELARGTEEIEAVRRTSTAMVERAAAVAEFRSLLGNVAILSLLIAGGIAHVAGVVALPSLLLLYVVLTLLRAQVAAIDAHAPAIREGLASLAQVTALLDVDQDPRYAGARGIRFRGALRFERVSFGYDDRRVLDRVDMEIGAGQCVLLSGGNGAGKSTLVRLALGLCLPHEGRILADDVAYETLDMDGLRRQIGVVPQFPSLFAGTVAENIGYGHPAASRGELECAAALAGAHDFVGRLPLGYDTPIGDTGSQLSGGERQRIAIARALVGAPRLLVLDEPFNHLAAGVLEPILVRLRAASDPPSVLLIAHNPEVSSLVDARYVLDGGRLMRVGTVERCASAGATAGAVA